MSYLKGERILMAEFDNVLRGFDEKSALILDMGQRVGNATGELSADGPLSERLEIEYAELETPLALTYLVKELRLQSNLLIII